MKKATLVFVLLLSPLLTHANQNQPKLIVQIVIDQLRGDLILQHQKQFQSQGFNYLLSHSLNYTNAHHPHANTTTCAGHATIATGSYPSLHGIVNNSWFDRKSKKMTYCTEDPKATILPTPLTKKTIPGQSPAHLTASTLSDEIRLAQKGRAFAVSLKDRSAITLAGHAGLAFWFDKTNGGFVSSSYYYSNYPQWVQKWNQHYSPQEFIWNLSRPLSEYYNAKNPVIQNQNQQFGQSFHHSVKPGSTEEYIDAFIKTPKADELTANFAEQLLVGEQLGSSPDHTDYLGISFSVVDIIGHQFGPNSLEAEDNLLQLDNTLAHLFAVLDKQVGLNNTLIILTADHGVDNDLSYFKANHGIESPSLNIEATEQLIYRLLEKQFQLPKETLMTIVPPYIYLDHELISSHKISLKKVSNNIALALTQQPGIFKAFPLPTNGIAKDWLSTKVNRMAYPERAGDIYLVPFPNQDSDPKDHHSGIHGSPWQYDSYVPLLFSHPGFKAQLIYRPVETTDIASTLSALLGINPPSAAVGKPLHEVLDAFNLID